MALRSVGVRTEGDVYQGLFFWKQAADLLRPSAMVERVVLEYDDADGVDDVVVFYRTPGINAAGRLVRADYFQLKYHVDNRNRYSADAIIDPTFINAKSSLLQRFFNAFQKLSKQERTPFRLHLASNWRWRDDDILANLLREDDGALPPKFFEVGSRGRLGKIRERWRSHLSVDVETFTAFTRTLRFQLDHFGRREFKQYVNVSLQSVGLRIPSANLAACPYESLVQQFMMNGLNSFNETEFRALCMREGLFDDDSWKSTRPFTIGVRSFMRFAERLESEVDQLVCVTANFEHRHLSHNGSWEASAAGVLTFLEDHELRSRLRKEESVIVLECHGSLAFLSGWELSRNSGVKIAPLQKPNLDVWRPCEIKTEHLLWATPMTIERTTDVDDVAVCLSVSRDLQRDVESYLSTPSAPLVRRLVVMSPEGGPSPLSIKGPDHAYQMAIALPGLLRSACPTRESRVHVFWACPISLMFFIGQQREAMGRLTLYEYDFGNERDVSYQPSLSFPLSIQHLPIT